MAIGHALELHAQGYNAVVDADIKASLITPSRIILEAVRDRVADGKVLTLLERFSPAAESLRTVGSWLPPRAPARGVISPCSQTSSSTSSLAA